MNKTIFFLTALCIIYNLGFLQSQNYNDVAVIVNDSSSNSINIGAFFQSQRNIPNQNIIHISCPDVEEIDSVQFEQIKGQINAYMISSGIDTIINFIVTTKGVPLKVNRNNSGPFSPWSSYPNASFDTELAASFMPVQTPFSAKVPNPFYLSKQSFKREDFGFVMVTRLTAEHIKYVYEMILKSGPNTIFNLESADTAIFMDIGDFQDYPSHQFVKSELLITSDSLNNIGWHSKIDSSSGASLIPEDLACYFYGSTLPSAIPNTPIWKNGAIASMLYCASAGTFDTNIIGSTPSISELITAGISGAHGYVYCADLNTDLELEIAFKNYLDDNIGFNLAESFYSGIMFLSWQDVIVGDPKSSLFVNKIPNNIQSYRDMNIKVYPNPITEKFVVQGFTGTLSIFNNGGQLLNKQIVQEQKELAVENYPSGIYFLLLENNEFSQRIKLIKE